MRTVSKVSCLAYLALKAALLVGAAARADVIGEERRSEVQIPCLQQTLNALPRSLEFDSASNRMVQTTRRPVGALLPHIEGCRNVRPRELRCRVLGGAGNASCVRAAQAALLAGQNPGSDQQALGQACQTLEINCN